MDVKLIVSWIKNNFVKILLVVCLVFVLTIVILSFGLKIKGFKVSDLIFKLQMANANNELSHLEKKLAVVETKEGFSRKKLNEIKDEVIKEKKRLETAKLKIQGMSDEEISNRFTELGY